jgi:aspartyl-tRNA(Asn)/glutamyl-tRNA(Gln) amidotransferase subunit C
MKLSLQEVEYIAELAKLGLSAQEKETFREQLSAILDYVEILQRVDTGAIPPTATVLSLHSVMRPDGVTPSMARDDALANAPEAQDGCFKVKAILE